MKRIRILMFALIGIFILSIFFTNGCGKSVIKSQAVIVSLDRNQLVNEATVIVSGKVLSSEVQDDFQGFPVTDYKIEVTKVYKGEPAPIVEVRTQGGENSKMKYIPDEDMVTFQLGEKVVLFLTDDKGNRPDKNDFDYFVVGQYQGKFKAENGKLVNKKYTFNSDSFAEELKQIEATNKANGLK